MQIHSRLPACAPSEKLLYPGTGPLMHSAFQYALPYGVESAAFQAVPFLLPGFLLQAADETPAPQIKDMPDTPEILMDKSLSEQYQPQSDMLPSR